MSDLPSTLLLAGFITGGLRAAYQLGNHLFAAPITVTCRDPHCICHVLHEPKQFHPQALTAARSRPLNALWCKVAGHAYKVRVWQDVPVTRTTHPEWLRIECTRCDAHLIRPHGWPGLEIHHP